MLGCAEAVCEVCCALHAIALDVRCDASSDADVGEAQIELRGVSDPLQGCVLGPAKTSKENGRNRRWYQEVGQRVQSCSLVGYSVCMYAAMRACKGCAARTV